VNKPRNRFTIGDDDSFSEEQELLQPKSGPRIRGIEKVSNPRRRQILAQIGLILGVTIITVSAILLVVKFKKPDLFSSSKPSQGQIAPADQIVSKDKVDLPEMESANTHLLRGKGSYYKGYLNDAMAEFTEVVESDASDKDKAIALTYMGIIEDTRGNYQKALEHYSRAVKYDPSNAGTFRNIAITYRNMNNLDEALSYIAKAIDLDPKSSNNLVMQGNLLFQLRRYSEAVKSYEKAVEIEPQNAAALYNIAQSYSRMGNDVQAIEYLRNAAAADKTGRIAYMAYGKLGLIALGNKDYPTAELNLSKAIALNDADPIDHYNLGVTYLEQGKKEDALREFTKAETLGSEDAAMLENLGEAYTSLQEYDRGIDIYKKLLTVNSRNVKVLSLLGDLLFQKGELEQALRFYKKIVEIEPASERAHTAFINIGIVLDEAQRFDEAIEAYNNALTINPKDDVALYNLGIAYKHAGKADEALKSWKKSSELNPDNEKPLIARADLLYERGEFDDALEDYGKIADKWPLLARPQFSIASIYQKKGLNDYAKKRYLKVVELGNDNELVRKAYLNLAMISSQGKKEAGEFNEAVSYVQKALLAQPGDAETLQSLGVVYYRRGSYDKAIESFYQVIKSSRNKPLLGQAYNQIGMCYYRKADYKKALRAFTQGVEEDPANEELRMNRKAAMQAYEQGLE
jgi:tetratricopeptide (TPR) repeat protein